MTELHELIPSDQYGGGHGERRSDLEKDWKENIVSLLASLVVATQE